MLTKYFIYAAPSSTLCKHYPAYKKHPPTQNFDTIISYILLPLPVTGWDTNGVGHHLTPRQGVRFVLRMYCAPPSAFTIVIMIVSCLVYPGATVIGDEVVNAPHPRLTFQRPVIERNCLHFPHSSSPT